MLEGRQVPSSGSSRGLIQVHVLNNCRRHHVPVSLCQIGWFVFVACIHLPYSIQ